MDSSPIELRASSFIIADRLLLSPVLFLLLTVGLLQSAEPKGTAWPRFRGELGNGHVKSFPDTPFRPRMLWQTPLPSQGVGGVAATEDFVVASSRSADDQSDVFVCLDPITGSLLWKVEYVAPGQLDYGTSPRATPLIHDPYVFLLGAFGDLTCVDIDSGGVKWRKHLVKDFGGRLPTWGFSWSPLLVENRLIVLPGGPTCAIASLSTVDGHIQWQSQGDLSAYASPVLATWSGQSQIVAYDRHSLGGFDLEIGSRLWSVTPPKPNDFNVPTPIVLPEGLLITSENNGTRLHAVDSKGRIVAEPGSTQGLVRPDAHTPVVVGSQVIAAERDLVSLDLNDRLAVRWRLRDRAFRGHNSLIAAGNRMLVITQTGEVLLVLVAQDQGTVLARFKLGDDAKYLLAHPALVNDVLYVRAESSLQAWALWE